MAPRRVLLPSPLQHSTRKPNGMSNTIELEVSPLAAGTAGLASRRGSSTDPLTWDLGNGTGMRAVARIERRMKGARPTRLDVYLTRRLGRDETLAQAAGYDDGGPADLLPCRGLEQARRRHPAPRCCRARRRPDLVLTLGDGARWVVAF